MRDCVYLGTVPVAEECSQVGDPDYHTKTKAECRRYITQLKRTFGEPPLGARYKVKAEHHDFGTYHEVVIEFNSENEDAVEYAYVVEGNLPEYWDVEEMVV